MSLIDQLDNHESWERYRRYKTARGNLTQAQVEDLSAFVDGRQYKPVIARIKEGKPFPSPTKKLISKTNSTKKRVLYVFPREENYVLKLMTFLAIRRYDKAWAPNLYSFRGHTDSKKAIMSLVRTPGIQGMHSYKIDVSNYFGSVDIDKLLPPLKTLLTDDPQFYEFLERLLTDRGVVLDGQSAQEDKGIMAGSPISTFLANVFLSDLDWQFADSPYPYARYSDDIIAFAPTKAEIDSCETLIREHLKSKGLSANPEKEARTLPGEKWVFLGISYKDGPVDIAPVSAQKLKNKMRRKSRSLLRWKARKGCTNQQAARALVKSMNRKLYEGTKTSDLTWSRWFFPLINTDKTLREIDAYLQDCIRYVATGKRNKARFGFRYQDMKNLGYRSLVHEYYKGRDSR